MENFCALEGIHFTYILKAENINMVGVTQNSTKRYDN